MQCGRIVDTSRNLSLLQYENDKLNENLSVLQRSNADLSTIFQRLGKNQVAVNSNMESLSNEINAIREKTDAIREKTDKIERVERNEYGGITLY